MIFRELAHESQNGPQKESKPNQIYDHVPCVSEFVHDFPRRSAGARSSLPLLTHETQIET